MSLKMGIMSFAHLHAYSYASAINFMDNTEFVGIADDDLDRAKEMAQRHHTRYFGSYEELLKEVDAVVITSENAHHKELAEFAARKGKHILCEKPLATTPDDAKAMIDVCLENGVQLMTSFPCRYSPAMRQIRREYQQGRIGKALAIRGTNRGRCPFGWFTNIRLSGGGSLMDHTVHVTDLMRWLLQSEVKSVYAQTSNGMFHDSFEDCALLTMEFDNGVFATLDSSWSRPKSFPTWGDVTLSVVGEKGILNMDMFSQNLIHYNDTDNGAHWHSWGVNFDLEMIIAFVNAIMRGEMVPVTGLDGLRTVEVVEAGYASASIGKPVAPRKL